VRKVRLSTPPGRSAGTTGGVEYPERISLGNFPTRVVEAPKLGAELGVRLFLKNEFEADAFGSGNKVRKLEFLLSDLIRRGYRGLTVDGTTQSNCAMALALYGPPVGLSVDLVLYGPTTPSGNYLDILHSDATQHLLPAWSPTEIDRKQREIVGGRKRIAIVPTGATNEMTSFAGIQLVQEIVEYAHDQGVGFDYVVFPTASGGTQAGLEIGRQIFGLQAEFIGVAVANGAEFFSDVASALGRNLQLPGLGANKLRPRTYMGALGEGYGVPLPGSLAEIQRLRHRHGVILDSVYTFKAFAGMRQLIDSGEIPNGSTILFVHTGGINERFVDLTGSP
jgi:1-aminocyclopropane-1-carboxylate deaminase/D-cysteine desulfhydrase-like pyridoxal-dependent ACC family enzyme